jgi:hypothetical protein
MELTVFVPDDRVAEFYVLHGRFLASDPGTLGSQQPGPRQIETMQVVINETAPWGIGDEDRAASIYRRLTPSARKIWDLWIDHPDRRFSPDELAALADLASPHVLAGTLAWPGRYCYSAGRELPFHWSSEHNAYWMDGHVAAVWAAARHGDGAR